MIITPILGVLIFYTYITAIALIAALMAYNRAKRAEEYTIDMFLIVDAENARNREKINVCEQKLNTIIKMQKSEVEKHEQRSIDRQADEGPRCEIHQ